MRWLLISYWLLILFEVHFIKYWTFAFFHLQLISGAFIFYSSLFSFSLMSFGPAWYCNSLRTRYRSWPDNWAYFKGNFQFAMSRILCFFSQQLRRSDKFVPSILNRSNEMVIMFKAHYETKSQGSCFKNLIIIISIDRTASHHQVRSNCIPPSSSNDFRSLNNKFDFRQS